VQIDAVQQRPGNARRITCHGVVVAAAVAHAAAVPAAFAPVRCLFASGAKEPQSSEIEGVSGRSCHPSGTICSSAATNSGSSSERLPSGSASTSGPWPTGRSAAQAPRSVTGRRSSSGSATSPSPEPTTLCERLRRKRWGRGLSIREVGSELGIDPATYQRWKAGTKVPSGKYLALVERFLGELQSGA